MPIPNLKVDTDDGKTRWFGALSCVVYEEDVVNVLVHGLLIGSYAHDDVFTRNTLVVGLSEENRFKKGLLAAAFGMSDEHRRRLCKIAQEEGMQNLPGRKRGGSKPKLNDEDVEFLTRLFEQGIKPLKVFNEYGEKLGVSYQTILRQQKRWKEKRSNGERLPQEKEAPVVCADESGQLPLLESPETEPSKLAPGLPADGPSDDDDIADAKALPVRNATHVQHLGGLLLVAMVASFGVYEAALKGWDASQKWRERLRMAFDAVIIALGIGQKCVEGVRRIDTPTGHRLLRTSHVPSESWVRRIIKRYVDGTGMANKFHLRMTGAYLAAGEVGSDEPGVFYIDNHMRPYTGKATIRKGWRMQDKRAVPGVSDYYVHDEDGRPVCRIESPSHGSLTGFLVPIAEMLRGALGDNQRIMVAFDRGGAFAEAMAELRDIGVEFATYERGPYPKLPKSAFTQKLTLDNGEVFFVHEKRLKNLGKGRGRTRRISLLTQEGKQINVLACSTLPAWRIVEIITGRWVQENGFKHGTQRWGINQLDRRKLVPFPPGTIIPNPARRRLEFSIKLIREKEGRLRCKLAELAADHPKRSELKNELEEVLRNKKELLAQRTSLPKHAPLQVTELEGELKYHDPHYKTVIDTLRIACANAEARLADELGAHMRKPAEAKKLLATAFASPGCLRVNNKSISVKIELAARPDEREAINKLFDEINDWNLLLPGDDSGKPLRFKTQL